MKKRKKTEFQRFRSMIDKLEYQMSKEKAAALKKNADESAKGDKS